MADSNVAVVKDKDGRVHYGARESKFVREGLKNGTLTEVSGADSSNASTGSRRNTKRAGGGSGDGKPASGTADGSAE